jgi:hypothetical protein
MTTTTTANLLDLDDEEGEADAEAVDAVVVEADDQIDGLKKRSKHHDGSIEEDLGHEAALQEGSARNAGDHHDDDDDGDHLSHHHHHHHHDDDDHHYPHHHRRHAGQIAGRSMMNLTAQAPPAKGR